MVSPGRGTPLYLPHRHVSPQTVWFLLRFGSENEYRLCLVWSEFGYGFGGNTGVHERICRFHSK